MTTVYQLGHKPIKDHVFSHDGTILAITKDNNVEIYNVTGSKPVLFAILKEHDKTVTSVDISQDGKILTCSQDRNALVWEFDGHEYKPTLVLLRINRAATVCRWSPNGSKFAVGSSDRAIAICFYEEENNWWVSKHLKKPIRLTITCLDWHPNNVLLVAGSTDGHVRVFSSYIKDLDQKPNPSVWGTKLPFQTLCGDYTTATGAWIHGVKFNPDGDSLAFVGHDSSISFIYGQGENQPPVVYNLDTNFLPFKTLVYVTPNKVVASGHNCNLVVFEGDANGWQFTTELEKQKDLGLVQVSASGPTDDDEISSHEALNMFRQLDSKGKVNQNKGLSTTHQNTISSLKLSNGKVSSSGIDGKVVIWSI